MGGKDGAGMGRGGEGRTYAPWEGAGWCFWIVVWWMGVGLCALGGLIEGRGVFSFTVSSM